MGDAVSDTPKATLWMPWFIRDHRSVASTLDHVEHSALCYLKMLLWENGGTIRDDDRWIAKNLRLPLAKWKALRSVVLDGCITANGCIKSPEISAEFDKAQANIEQKRKAGIASAIARKEATAVERALNGRSNGSATARQPRAGSGGGSGPIQEGSYHLDGMGDGDQNPFAVVKGGK